MDAGQLRVGLLGPLELWRGSIPVEVHGERARVVLVTLALSAGRPVAASAVAQRVWNESPPHSVQASLASHVTRLRHAVGSAAIRTTAAGYLLDVDADQVDALRFQRLTAEAAREGDPDKARELLAAALGLWRGEPLEGVVSEVLHRDVVPILGEDRLLALERRIDLDLAAGAHADVLSELIGLTARHPLREPQWRQLITALAASGRHADALEAYAKLRTALRAELGVEPTAELQELFHRLLDGRPLTETSARPGASSGMRRGSQTADAVPRQLPAAVGHFTGRHAELDQLLRLVEAAENTAGQGGAVVISAIGGTAGIGKTALAVHWAHQHADLFSDGQLYVNLRGFDPSGTPMAPTEAMRRFLDALGVPPRRIPADPDEQAALYRSQLADRRMLVLLDNARDAEQVRPLLPGSPGSLVLVTSRNQLSGLVALDGAVPLTLDLFTEDEARDLLIGRLGHQRVRAEQRAATELIALCARLPLALNIAAARAALHPARPLAQLVERLRDARRRLDALTTGEDAADIRAVFSWSYHTLDSKAARVFRLLSVHPGPEIGLPAAASLTALDLDRTRRVLNELTRAHLVSEQAADRYTFHDLLRAYAAEQAHAHDSQDERHDALRRVCDFYLHTAHAADRLAAPHRPPMRLEPPAPGTRPRSFADVLAAMAWFEAEHPNLLAVQHTAATRAWHPIVWQLAWTLTTFHARRGHRHDELAVWQAALAAAAHLPDPAARTLAHRLLGRAHADLGRHDEAIGHLHQALALAEHHHDPTDQAHTHRLLAWAWEQQGDDRQAMAHATRALNLFSTLDQPTWQANTHDVVGWYAARLGDYETARTHCYAALALYRRHNDPNGEALALDTLGYIEHHTGHHQQAIDHHQQSLALFRTLGNTYQFVPVLDKLGHPLAALGQHEQARTVWRQALEMYRQQGRTQDAERVQRQLDTLEWPDGG